MLADYRRSVATVFRNGSLRLLWNALVADGGTSRGVVLCSPERFFPDAENAEDFYDELCGAAFSGAPRYDPIPDRVLLISSGLGAGGAERQIANTLVGLRSADVDTHYVGLWLENVDGNRFHLDHVRAHGVPTAHMERRADVARKGLTILPPAVAEVMSHMSEYMLEQILNLIPAIREHRPTVVHSWLDETNVQVGIAAAILGVPRVILSCRSVSPTHFAFHQDYMRPAYRALMRLPNMVMLNNSAAGADSYAEWLGIERDRITVLRNGVDLSRMRRADPAEVSSFREEMGLPDGVPVIGSIYRLGPEKRPRLWLDACRRVLDRHPDTHFLIVGDGVLRGDIESYAREIGVADRLRLPGIRQDVHAALSAMDAFLLTSDVEGLPNVLIEAQWLGIPVVTTRAGGTPEALAHGRTGLLAEEGTPETIGAHLTQILDDDALRARVRKEGPAFVTEQFGISRMIDETIGCYGFRRAEVPYAAKAS